MDGASITTTTRTVRIYLVIIIARWLIEVLISDNKNSLDDYENNCIPKFQSKRKKKVGC